jgi:hypothetical protein
MYFVFDASLIPQDCTVEQENSASGDMCHYNVSGINEKTARLLTPKTIAEVNICEKTDINRPLSLDDLKPYC